VLTLQRDRLTLGRRDEVDRRARGDVGAARGSTEPAVAAGGLTEPARPEAAGLLAEHREAVLEVLGALEARASAATLVEHREHVLEAVRTLTARREAGT